jgi:hypothetical protein
VRTIGKVWVGGAERWLEDQSVEAPYIRPDLDDLVIALSCDEEGHGDDHQ